MDEFSWIQSLRASLTGQLALPWGIGDDAAILRSLSVSRVIATDVLVEGVHFRREWSSLEDIAFKLYASNASDMWAMGAKPVEWLLTVAWPQPPSESDALALARGFEAAMVEWGAAPLIGGDTSKSHGSLMLGVTMLGEVLTAPWLRSGFVPGDRLWVDGPLGLAAAGLAELQAFGPRTNLSAGAESGTETGAGVGANTGVSAGASSDAGSGESLIAGTSTVADSASACVHQQRRPRRQAAVTRFEARGAIDVSDGLSVDLLHAAKASGVTMILDQALPGTSALEDAARRLKIEASKIVETCDHWQLRGGEDYVRVVGFPERPGDGWTCIGYVEAGLPSVFDERRGERQALHPAGWNHFQKPPTS